MSGSRRGVAGLVDERARVARAHDEVRGIARLARRAAARELRRSSGPRRAVACLGRESTTRSSMAGTRGAAAATGGYGAAAASARARRGRPAAAPTGGASRAGAAAAAGAPRGSRERADAGRGSAARSGARHRGRDPRAGLTPELGSGPNELAARWPARLPSPTGGGRSVSQARRRRRRRIRPVGRRRREGDGRDGRRRCIFEVEGGASGYELKRTA